MVAGEGCGGGLSYGVRPNSSTVSLFLFISILHLKLFNIFTKNITERSSKTAKLHQENGGQYVYRHIKAQKYFQSWVSNHCS